MFAYGRWTSPDICLTVRSVLSVTDTADGWDLVSARLEREMAVRGSTPRAIEQAVGFSTRTLKKLLDGEPVARADRLAVLAGYFGWQGDAFTRIRHGEEPVPLDNVASLMEQTDAAAAQLAKVTRELDEVGERLDELEARWKVFASFAANIDPEELRKYLPLDPKWDFVYELGDELTLGETKTTKRRELPRAAESGEDPGDDEDDGSPAMPPGKTRAEEHP